VQPFVSLLLYVALGQAEQSLPIVPAGMVHSTDGKVIPAPTSHSFCSPSRLQWPTTEIIMNYRELSRCAFIRIPDFSGIFGEIALSGN
jgi:hypothetical protein